MLSEDSQSPSAFRERMKRRSTSVSGLASAEKTRGRSHRLLTTRERNASRKRLGFAIEVRCQYEGGLSISLSAVISMQPLGIEQANNPHMKAKDVPFHMGYGGLICSKALQNDRPK